MSGIISLHLSDHVPIFLIRKKPRNEARPITLKTRGSRLDIDLLESEFGKVDWNFVMDERDPSKLWDRMFECIMKVVDRLYPLREFTVKNGRPDYIDDEIIRAGKERDLAFEKALKTKDESDWETAVKARRKANSALRCSKYNFINGNIVNSSGDPKRFWRQVLVLIPNVNSQPIDIIMAEDGITPLHNTAACNRINEYFCNISVKLSNKLKQGIPWSDMGNKITRTEIWNLEIREKAVLKIIDEIEEDKASGFLCIGSKLLKRILRILAAKFTVLLNLVLNKAIFPVGWKTAITTVIPKVGDVKLVSNLRPISLIPMPGKIMEKILNSIIIDYLESSEALFVRQGGFRKGRLTVKTAYDLVNHVLLNKYKGFTSVTAFIDIAKAFNCINHVLLLKKLKSLSFPDSFIILLESYLENRKQVVKLNGFTSEARVIIDGIPQGSNLGPMLFLIYMNDLMYVKFKGFLNLFADDSCLTVTGKDYNEISDNLNHDLDLFSTWCTTNKLTINAKKTKIVVFRNCKRNKSVLNRIYLGGEVVEIVPEYTYLGFVLDENLSFISHINGLIRASTVKVFTLLKIRRFRNCDTAVTIFKSFILPKLEYGDVFYCGVTKKCLHCIQIIMNKALRICYRSKREDSNYYNHLVD